jgi:hypothetical protein
MADCLRNGNACLVMHQAKDGRGRGCFGGLVVGTAVGTASWLRAGVVWMAGVGGRVVGDY